MIVKATFKFVQPNIYSYGTLGSSSLASFNNCSRFPSFFSCPLMLDPCLARNFKLDNNFIKQYRLLAFSCASELTSISPTLGVVAGNVISFSTANLWQRLFSCCLNAAVPSFQLQNPLDNYLL